MKEQLLGRVAGWRWRKPREGQPGPTGRQQALEQGDIPTRPCLPGGAVGHQFFPAVGPRRLLPWWDRRAARLFHV